MKISLVILMCRRAGHVFIRPSPLPRFISSFYYVLLPSKDQSKQISPCSRVDGFHYIYAHLSKSLNLQLVAMATQFYYTKINLCTDADYSLFQLELVLKYHQKCLLVKFE